MTLFMEIYPKEMMEMKKNSKHIKIFTRVKSVNNKIGN